MIAQYQAITDSLMEQLNGLSFSPPVACVYNPLEYAREPYDQYFLRYGFGSNLRPDTLPPRIILLGMNPGPYGMAQSGVPFGDVTLVRDWLKITGRITSPSVIHPRRPITGWQTRRREGSGSRVWGWARERFLTPERFFQSFYVLNYCPLVFMLESGANLTLDKLKAQERRELFSICDRALKQTMRLIGGSCLIALGRFTYARAQQALADLPLPVAYVTHPSPANPQANHDWGRQLESAIEQLGIGINYK